jgi:hypothetical protein
VAVGGQSGSTATATGRKVDGGVGVFVGVGVGSGVGVFVGVGVGSGVGVFVGVAVGSGVGVFVGVAVGSGVGVFVGVAVGSGVGQSMIAGASAVVDEPENIVNARTMVATNAALVRRLFTGVPSLRLSDAGTRRDPARRMLADVASDDVG